MFIMQWQNFIHIAMSQKQGLISFSLIVSSYVHLRKSKSETYLKCINWGKTKRFCSNSKQGNSRFF